MTLFITLIWVAAMRLTSDNKTCWEDYSEDNSIFIIVIPILSILLVSNIKKCTDYLNYSNNQNHSYQIIIVLLLLLHQVNLLFLISIMKVVVTSLRTRSSLTRQQLQVNKEFWYTLEVFNSLRKNILSTWYLDKKSCSINIDSVSNAWNHKSSLFHKSKTSK